MAELSPLGLSYVGLAAALVKALTSAGAAFAQRRLASRAGDAERRAAASALLRAGAREPVAATNAALALATRELEAAVEAGLLGALKALIALVPLALALVLLSPALALALVLALGPVYGLLARLRGRLRRALGRAQALAERLHGQVDDVVRHLDVHRSFGQGPRALRILSEGAEEASRAASRAEASRAALSGGNEALAALGLVVAVAAAGAGLFSFAEVPLVPAAALVLLAYRPLRDLGDARAFAERGALAYARLDAIAVALKAEDVSGEKGKAARREQNLPMCTERTWTPAPIEVKGVILPWSRRRGGATSFRLEPGEVAVLTGSTGSGKTTLLRILLGLEPAPPGASIRHGDEELGGRGAGPSERPFGWVPQEAPLIAGTVLENVRLGRPGASELEALAALEAVGGAELAARGAERLEAGGATLSGGERQLVAIARALVSAQPVLLLDEPTSGLDDVSAARVLSALSALRGHRTLLLVTHRPEPASIADRVLHLG